MSSLASVASLKATLEKDRLHLGATNCIILVSAMDEDPQKPWHHRPLSLSAHGAKVLLALGAPLVMSLALMRLGMSDVG